MQRMKCVAGDEEKGDEIGLQTFILCRRGAMASMLRPLVIAVTAGKGLGFEHGSGCL